MAFSVHVFWETAVEVWGALYWDGVKATFLLITTYHFIKVITYWRNYIVEKKKEK